ncbi:hypothetical protein PFISCL1PPCAC_7058, partial [Pristionchus fissidentatus]
SKSVSRNSRLNPDSQQEIPQSSTNDQPALDTPSTSGGRPPAQSSSPTGADATNADNALSTDVQKTQELLSQEAVALAKFKEEAEKAAAAKVVEEKARKVVEESIAVALAELRKEEACSSSSSSNQATSSTSRRRHTMAVVEKPIETALHYPALITEPSSANHTTELTGERRVGWVTSDDVALITSEWKCVGQKCQKTKMMGTRNIDEKIYVLNCGHFLCGACKELRKRDMNAGKPYKCCMDGCPGSNTYQEMKELPQANHTMALRKVLQQRGILCSECGLSRDRNSGPKHFHAREAIFVCKNTQCTAVGVLKNRKRDFTYDLTFDRGFTRKVPATPEAHQKLTRLCFLCAKRSEKHEKHDKVRISEVPGMNFTLYERLTGKLIARPGLARHGTSPLCLDSQCTHC